jgi:6,7-dimethyl-8-ribityllumazine synthase
MAQEITPGHDAQGHRFCLVAARFNQVYVERMVKAALEVLRGRGAAETDLTVIWVPGSFELPLTCRWAASSGRYDAVLAFGTLVRGETEHFRLVADVSAQGLLQAMMETDVPVLNGVLAVHDAEQAAARTGGALGNRGAEVALAAVQMGRLHRELRAR